MKLSIKYVPDKYEINEEYTTDEYSYLHYLSDNTYFFVEKYADPDLFMLNTEDTDGEKIIINSLEVTFIQKEDVLTAFWIYDGCAYDISGNIDSEVIIELIENNF